MGFTLDYEDWNFVLAVIKPPVKIHPMIHEFSEQLLNKLQEDLQAVAAGDVRPQIVLREQSRLVYAALAGMQEFLIEHPFTETDIEIRYQKYMLPQFYALLFYTREHYELVSGLPDSGLKVKRKYYAGFLKKIAVFFGMHGFYYDYWIGDGQLLDDVLYTAADPFNVLQPVVSGFDLAPGTAMSRLAGMFMGYERLRTEVLSLLYRLEGKPALSDSKVSDLGVLSLAGLKCHFQWKGEVIHLIELAHGIYLTGQLEDKVGVVEFFKVLGDFFGVNLRVPKRGFDDLKKRKTMSQTHYCELMQKALLAKMEEEDAFDPERTARRNGFFK